MANTTYTIQTNFTAKDSLPSGDPAKIIKGAEFGTEFSSIKTVVDAKADLASPEFTGTVTAGTLNVTGTLTAGTIDGGTY
jgi:hypothetical protein